MAGLRRLPRPASSTTRSSYSSAPPSRTWPRRARPGCSPMSLPSASVTLKSVQIYLDNPVCSRLIVHAHMFPCHFTWPCTTRHGGLLAEKETLWVHSYLPRRGHTCRALPGWAGVVGARRAPSSGRRSESRPDRTWRWSVRAACRPPTGDSTRWTVAVMSAPPAKSAMHCSTQAAPYKFACGIRTRRSFFLLLTSKLTTSSRGRQRRSAISTRDSAILPTIMTRSKSWSSSEIFCFTALSFSSRFWSRPRSNICWFRPTVFLNLNSANDSPFLSERCKSIAWDSIFLAYPQAAFASYSQLGQLSDMIKLLLPSLSGKKICKSGSLVTIWACLIRNSSWDNAPTTITPSVAASVDHLAIVL